MKKNERRHTRIKLRAKSSRVRVGGALHLGLAVENLSLGGAFVRCPQAPPLRSHATLELTVPGVNQPLVLPGQVAFVVPVAEAARRKVPAGFAIEFDKPLPAHVLRGLEHLLRELDPNALIALNTDESASARTQSLEAFQPPDELAALRKLVTAHEREIARLEKENLKLRSQVQQLQRR